MSIAILPPKPDDGYSVYGDHSISAVSLQQFIPKIWSAEFAQKFYGKSFVGWVLNK